MNEESPIIPSLADAQKRSQTAIDGASSDNEEDPAPLPALVLTVNQNAVSALQCYNERKRLHVDQSTEVTLLLNLGAIVTAQPSFEVSLHLEKNIDNYAAAILLSSKISTYEGTIPTNTLLDILKKKSL
ncbi:hypothetical protein DFH08DRAFT_827918 [Mycena albidolilacea]|uniref:Uncharacterized protein n=1 Tax=Mycena albidolilacea TaxID=1033008 RepID=A0AAD7E6R8_9AGAR|nr:hypothetical protein DFH08DRAFT_827918 [Mycena albidolilacea]